MIIDEELSVDEFLSLVDGGKKLFELIEVNDSPETTLANRVYDGISFINCMLCADFSNSSMRKCRFINCNIKTCIFDNCDMRDAVIDGCSVESISLKNANVDNVLFTINYAYGFTLYQQDFHKLLED